MVDSALYAAAIKQLWVDTCTVHVKKNEKKTGSAFTTQTEQVLFRDEPCRLSFKNVTVPAEKDHAARTEQSTVLLIGIEKEIPAGSEIVVTHEGVTNVYERSGEPAVYSVHQEVPLVLKGAWA